MWEEFLPNSIKNTNVKWYLFKHDENTKNIHYLVPLSVKFYQIFIFIYDFDTDLFLSTSCSQLISGESLARPLNRSHLIYNSNGSWVWVKVAGQLGGRNTMHAHRSIGVADLNSTRPKRQNWDKLGPIKSPCARGPRFK